MQNHILYGLGLFVNYRMLSIACRDAAVNVRMYSNSLHVVFCIFTINLAQPNGSATIRRCKKSLPHLKMSKFMSQLRSAEK